MEVVLSAASAAGVVTSVGDEHCQYSVHTPAIIGVLYLITPKTAVYAASPQYTGSRAPKPGRIVMEQYIFFFFIVGVTNL